MAKTIIYGVLVTLMSLSIILTVKLLKKGSEDRIKIAIINDVHLDPYYEVNVSSKDSCRGKNPLMSGSNIKDAPSAFLGRWGCDSPMDLVDTITSYIVEKHSDLDVLMMSGDFTGHGISTKEYKDQKIIEAHYKILKSTMSDLFTN